MPRNIWGDPLKPFAAGYDPKINQPLDDRTQVSGYNDLFLESTWGESYYPGMMVVVHGDVDPSKDGVYLLKSNEDWDHNLPEHWEKIGGSTEGSSSGEGRKLVNINLTSQLNYSEPQQVFVLPEPVLNWRSLLFNGLAQPEGIAYGLTHAGTRLTVLLDEPPIEGDQLMFTYEKIEN